MQNLLHASNAHRVLIPTVLILLLTCRGTSAQVAVKGFEGWDLEPGVGQAHLVMVARVASISRVTVVEGAKTDVALREYRFQPVRLLKGIFQRDQLSMTASDLGLPDEEAASAPPLKEGEFRLLILAQQRRSAFGQPSYGCVSAASGATTFDERVPLLTGPDDPLVAVVETLIRVVHSRSRRERATLLVDRLVDVDGVAAVPLLVSLKLRTDWAATEERAFAPLARLASNPQRAVRGAAVEVLRDILASCKPRSELGAFDRVARAIREILDSDEANTAVRLAALEALGNLIAVTGDDAAAHELLISQLKSAATHAERAAAATALSRVTQLDAAIAVGTALTALPLDETPQRESVYARAAGQLDQFLKDQIASKPDVGAERVLLDRLRRSIAARQSLEAEVAALGQMRSRESVPILLVAAGEPNVTAGDRRQIALALGQLNDDRAVTLLIGWLRGNNDELKELALSALETIDTQTAAQEARPSLRTEPNLSYKLRIARLLARHGMSDGYELATEHLADEEHKAAATLVLAALDDPRTQNDLSAIIESRPDRSWHAAALAGLATIGDAAARDELLEILNDDRNPLAADAAEAAGLASDSGLLPPLAKLVQSRNEQIARASLLALRRYLSGVRLSPRGLAATDAEATDLDSGESQPAVADIPEKTRAEIAEAVASLAADAYVDADLRFQALAVARLLRGESFSELLSNLADQAELEGTQLLTVVQAERRRSRVLQP